MLKRIGLGIKECALVILRIVGLIPPLDTSKNELLSITNKKPVTAEEADEVMRDFRGCILRKTPKDK
jgi:hypothetical protein